MTSLIPLPVKLLLGWVSLVARHPRVTLFSLALLTSAAGYIALDRYAMNSRLGDLVAQDASWRDDYDAFQQAFPQLVETAIVVVSGESSQKVERRARALEFAIKSEPDLFVDVYAPANDAFFADHALLYLDLQRLDEVADQLARAQPVISAVSRDPSLGGVLQLVIDSASQLNAEAGLSQQLLRTVNHLQTSAAAALEGRDADVPWRDEFLRSEEATPTSYRLIFLRGQKNYGVALPGEKLISRLRELIELSEEKTDAESQAVSVTLTGELALRHDEVAAATGGVKIAGVVALVLLGAVLAFGVRSLRIVLATFAVLLVGVVWTLAWALLSVGSFNTLSLVFLVMFFGLGVDFCVHYSLRVQEAATSLTGANDADALDSAESGSMVEVPLAVATRSVGGAVVLCTLTTAIGFLGFLPTPYKGLADLGVISAGGMVVACVLTFTLLPALFAAFGLPKPNTVSQLTASRSFDFLAGHRSTVFTTLALCLVCALWFVPRMQFDYSVLALRDPDAESMRALRDLQREKQITDYALYTLVDPLTIEQQKKLSQLDTVGRVITPLDYLPQDVEDKLFVLEDLQELLGGSLAGKPSDAPASSPTIQATVLREQLQGCARELQALLQNDPGVSPLSPQMSSALTSLTAVIGEILRSDDRVSLAWQTGAVDTLLEEINWLQRAIDVQRPEFEDLPKNLRSRLVAPDGRYLTAILPSQDITPVAELNRFITTVRDEVSNATGRPVVEWGVGNIVLSSFKTALLVALSGITLTLLVVLRSIRYTLLVLTPLVLTAVFTVATSVLLGVAINMASVLVLPLIFGLGVDNGIHMVERYRAEPSKALALMRSSTPRAVLLSTLTTIGTFAALMLSDHAGTASIGFLLTVAVSYLLLFTLFLLPLLLSVTGERADVAASN